jgi:hypothetical protein
MGDLLGVELLSNGSFGGEAPKLDIKMADLESIEIPTLSSEPPSAPKLSATFEETGPVQIGGLDNLNAAQYMTSTPKRMSDETVMKEKYEKTL